MISIESFMTKYIYVTLLKAISDNVKCDRQGELLGSDAQREITNKSVF